MKKYIDPEVRLIDGTEYDLGFYTWLKSRRKVIKLEDGTPIDDVHIDGVTTDDLYFDSNYHIIFEIRKDNGESDMKLLVDKSSILSNDELKLIHPGMRPSTSNKIYQFYVDNELVEFEEYRDRIIKSMNLQYNNFPQYIFEIQGSALFRDLLYVINWSGQWAESNRFLFSILPDSAVLDEENYHISSEYKDIPEWENQFQTYMNKIHETQITDENRTEMPYSISSFFWWGCNHKTLINLLSMLKLKMPFFYNTYGIKLMDILDISENDLKPYVDASLQQYFRCEDWKKGSIKNSGFYIINTEISYIILSQFLRQSPSIISGVFDDLEHSDPNEFSHKVFKGDTICKITFVSHEKKLMSTVSKRSCNFAANSGTGAGSWSGFLEDFLKSVNTPDELRSLLPCKFDENGLLKFCPLWDDVKFRNSGTESRNCVCPLTTCKIDDAKSKCMRDKNRLSDLFYKLTEDMISKGGSDYIHDLNNK